MEPREWLRYLLPKIVGFHSLLKAGLEMPVRYKEEHDKNIELL